MKLKEILELCGGNNKPEKKDKFDEQTIKIKINELIDKFHSLLENGEPITKILKEIDTWKKMLYYSR